MNSGLKDILPKPVWKVFRRDRRKLSAMALKGTFGEPYGNDIISVFNSYA
jgi:hypothetical protein